MNVCTKTQTSVLWAVLKLAASTGELGIYVQKATLTVVILAILKNRLGCVKCYCSSKSLTEEFRFYPEVHL